MANENLFRAILELDVEFSKTSKGLDEVAAQYGKVNKVAEDNQKKLQELANEEAKILEARKKANNPSVIVKYNNELKNVQGQIKAITAEQNKLAQAEKTTAKEADNLNKSLKNAFTVTQLNAMKKELKALGVEFSSVSSGAKKFLADTAKGIQQPINRFTQLKAEIKAAKGELAAAFGSGNQAAIQAASQKVGRLKDEFDDLNDATRQFASGSKFQVIGNVFGDISRKLIDLDFEGAADRSKALLQATKAITFKDAITGIGQLGTTLLNVGKSLLLNPIFLIGAAVALIITNFDKLKNSGGLVGTTFRAIGEVAEGLKIGFFELTDAIGLTTHALDELEQRRLEGLRKDTESLTKIFDNQIKILQAGGKSTIELEKKKFKTIEENAFKELTILQERRKRNKFLSEEEQKQLDEAVQRGQDAGAELLAIDAKITKERTDRAKKYAEDVSRVFDDLNKQIKAESVKTSEFLIKNTFGEGSKAQLEATFALRKQLENDAFKETEKTVLKEVKTKADIEKAKLKLTELRTKQEINFEHDKGLAILEVENANAKQSIERQNANNLLLLEASEDTELGIARQKLLIQTDYYDQSIKLAEQDIEKRKALGFDTTAQDRALVDLRLKAQAESSKALDELNKMETDAAIKQTQLQESQSETQLKLQNSRNSTILANELKFEQDKLEILRQGGKAYEAEAKAQADKVALLEKETNKARRLENISYYEQLSQAAITATNKIIDTKIREIEAQTNLQQKRVDEAKNIADSGNAELLELEKERLDNLNKEKEKFVRAQQALATIELISNTAIAVSKAAAEGGVAAGITIAATLLALVAGLAQARSIAGQAAFYEGGYTGDGNPRETSTALGRKNYTYHKGEFVFDHEKTGKYRKIFEDVHNDRVDLGEMRDKALMYDYFKNLTSMNTQVPVFMPPSVVNNTVEIKELRGQMSELINVVKNQQTNISLDKRGFYGSLKNVVDRDNFLSKEAKP